VSATPKIQDYAVIGNGRSAALISNRGSIDWLCWPRFDSASIFGAILDPNVGGAWSIRPTAEAEIDRRYIDNTNVLETRFRTASGTIMLTDFMPVTSEEHKRRQLWPEHEIIRQVRCENGEAEVEVDFNPRPDYGRIGPVIKDAGNLGLRIDIGTNLLSLRGDAQLHANAKGGRSAATKLKAGESIAFSLTFSTEGPAVIPPLGDLVGRKLQLTIDWWQRWADQAKYDGQYRREVIRSALVLKLLSYAPSGAIIAAPTTSLPERVGAELNWDYRFAWLRDASFTVRALFGLGYKDDADAFVSWLLHATRLTRPELRILYDVYGELPSKEIFLPHLRGYRESRPVRIGNAASEQMQLDVYGEVVEAVARFFPEDRPMDREVQAVLWQSSEYVCDHWREPDSGMWEYRGEKQHYTHSKLMCWVAVDLMLQMHQRRQTRRIDVVKCEKNREAIRREIEERAWNERVQAYTQAQGSEQIDASALLLSFHGFEEARSERMQQTYQRIREKLQPRPGLLYRDEQSRDRREGAFALCSFWQVDFLARGGGTLEEADATFKNVMAYANDVGLFGEEIDPETGDALGNFPQGFTHLGVINAALSLRDREQREVANSEGRKETPDHRARTK
jgi:GH15 family glucan-1,4-alpha-glucosidase